jgi:hypothetical protein
MTPPPFIQLPLSTFENMKMELSWRFCDLLDQILEICDDLDGIKETLNSDRIPRLPYEFDPLTTIGKY